MKNLRGNIRPATLAVALVALGAMAMPATLAAAAPAAGNDAQASHDPVPAPTGKVAPGTKAKVDDDRLGPLAREQAVRRQDALQKVIAGDLAVKDSGRSKVAKLSNGRYVELSREKTDKIFVILAEFGDKVDPQYGGTPGPLHNQIAEPDRTTDNSTAWQKDYNAQSFQDLYFSHDAKKESVAKYYEKQSSGRYSVDGEVSDWVKVDYNEARYGNNKCGATNCATVEDLVRDGTAQWAADQKAKGRTAAQIKTDLAQYDQWDRYDFDHDGNFNEPDGYIDHFQIVHAGEDESAGGGAQGTDALWAHRGYAYQGDEGFTGPAGNQLGGTPIGDTGIWVGDYTMQPENGGLGVYAHEYGHDLGLPDLYDTTYIGENGTAFWSLMSSGSWLSNGTTDIGSLPGDMDAWDKMQLGWLKYDTAKAAKLSTHKLGVAEYNTKDPQALVVTLPSKSVTTAITTPFAGTKQWWSGAGNDLRNTLTRHVDLTGKTSAALSFKGWYDTEDGYDYVYTEVSTNGGVNWAPIDGTIDGQPITRNGSGRPAVTGTTGGYKDMNYPLDAFAGQQIELRFRYRTDGGVAQKGFAADELKITADGATVFTDGAEGDDNGWTANGFSRSAASFTKDYPQYYIAENRQYVSYDKVLKTGPYNFGFGAAAPKKVEHYAYQNGLLIWLWDTSQLDNNVGEHPGHGQILPIDAHAKPDAWSDGALFRNKIQSADSTFGWYPTDALTVHKNGVATTIKSKPGVPVFDDRHGTYWYDTNPYASVQVPNTNTRISILFDSPSGQNTIVAVSPAGR